MALTDTFRPHDMHYFLVTDEPLLSCVILTISSRLQCLPGPGGQTRSAYLHDRLWGHVQQLLLRLLLGQEKLSKGKLRSLGTMEALLLLTEWHPRAVAFPPSVDGWDSSLLLHSDEHGAHLPKESAENVQCRWAEDVVRPARKFDQMSWMLLSTAMGLACEMGLFEEPDFRRNKSWTRSASDSQNRIRRLRILLYVYAEQLSIQVGATSIIPQSVQNSMLAIKIGTQGLDIAAPADERNILGAWLELTKLSRLTADTLLHPATETQQLITSGRYVALIDHLKQSLLQCEKKYLQEDQENGSHPPGRAADRHI